MYVEFKPGEKYASTGADQSEDIEAFQDCGYVLTKDDLIADIDHLPKESIKALLDIFDIHTQVVWTDRGAHLYFQRPEGMKRVSNGVCKLGFDLELKTVNNTPNGITIRRNGLTRQIDNPGVREEFPEILKATKKKYENLTGLQQGDGRNEKLYAHKKALKNCNDWHRILKFINDHVFAEPLDAKEFGVLSRQEAEEQQNLEECETAQRLMETRKFVKYGGVLWFWDYGQKKFISDSDLMDRVIRQYCRGRLTKFSDEVAKQILKECPVFRKGHVFKIKFRNGFLDKGRFFELDDFDEFTPYAIDIEYDPNAEHVPIVDEYLRQLTTDTNENTDYTDEDFRQYHDLLLETMAFGFVVDPEMTRKLSRFFIFRGDGANGKGTMLQIIKKILGEENCSFQTIEDLADERKNISLVGKLVNLGDDIEDKPISKKAFKVMKNITTADDIEIRPLYKNPEHVQIQTKLIFTSNADIRTFDKGPALKRRMYWMPMFNKVEKPDQNFISRITTEKALKYWIRLLVEAYQRLYKDGWTYSKICADYNDQYHIHNDIAEMFVRELGVESFLGCTTKEVQDAFDAWNTEDDRKLSMKNFKRAVWELHQAGFGLKKKDNTKTTTRILMLQSATKQNLKPTFK